MAYFGQFELDCPAVAMVTASHNDNGWTGVKMGARVVPGTIEREAGGRAVSFAVTDGNQTIPVTYPSKAARRFP